MTIISVRQAGAKDVRLGIVVRSAAAQETKRQTGLAALVAHGLITPGTSKRAKANTATLERLATDIEVTVDPEWTGFGMRVLLADAGEGAELLASIIRSPMYDNASLAAARKEVDSLARRRAAMPGGRCWRTLRSELLGTDDPASRDPYALPSALSRLSQHQVVSFHSRWYVPERTAFIVVGDVSLERASEMGEMLFGGWKKGRAVATPVQRKTAAGGRVVLVDDKDAKQVILCAGSIIPSADSVGWGLIAVTNMIIGGDYSSRLNRRLRGQLGMTYSIRSMLQEGAHARIFWLLSAVSRDVAAPAVGEVLGVLQGLRAEPPAAEEFETARALAEQERTMRYEGRGSALSAVTRYFGVGLPLDLDRDVIASLGSIGMEDVLAATDVLFSADRLVFVLVGPAGQLREQLEKLDLPLVVVSAK